MKKQLIFSTENFYYKLDEDGEVVYDEYGEEYDGDGAQWAFEDLVEQLDEDKMAKYPRREAKVKIYPDLGLWDGRHKCQMEEEQDFETAIRRCIMNIDSFDIYKAGKWTLYIDARHHDGTNHFKLTCYN